MLSDAIGRLSHATRASLLGLGVILVMGGAAGPVRAEPPIQSPEDAACREVARSKVFSAPDPLNLGLREIGRRIYNACMTQYARPTKARKARYKHRRRR